MSMFKRFQKSIKVITPHTKRLLFLFPDLEWNLRKAGLDISAAEYLAILISIPIAAFFVTFMGVMILLIIIKRFDIMLALGIPIVIGLWFFLYILLTPKRIISRRANLIDKDLGYMMRDMQIQLSSGMPLFNVLENISMGGYGECSKTMDEIVDAIESGRSMTDVLNDYGLISPSAYMRRILGQIANALKTGSDISSALEVISWSIQLEREDKISRYGHELAVIGLIYLVLIIVLPSMGVALIIILSSFFGRIIEKTTLYLIAIGVVFTELLFVSIIKSRRPII